MARTDGGPRDRSPSHELRLPADADPDVAAAITAAVEQLLAEETRAAAATIDGDDPWAGRRFAFAGRLAKLTGASVRVPRGAPADPWAAMGRAERR